MRLDRYLVEAGLAESREKAKALIKEGRVRVGGEVVNKPAHPVGTGDAVEVEPGARYVGRAALKLKGALSAFPVDPAGKVALDVGAGTGGFTEVLLEHGARRVYAVDVGRGQLHPRLAADPRVVPMEGVNAREGIPLPEPAEFAVMDVAFISSTLVLPALGAALLPGADALVLVKPQFELGPGVRVVGDPEGWRRAVERVKRAARELGFAVRGEAESPLAGKRGNREFWLWLGAPRQSPGRPDSAEAQPNSTRRS